MTTAQIPQTSFTELHSLSQNNIPPIMSHFADWLHCHLFSFMWQISELFSQPKVLIPDIKGSEQYKNYPGSANFSVLRVLDAPSTIKSSFLDQRHLTKIFCLKKKSNTRLPLPQHPIISTQIPCKGNSDNLLTVANSSITIYSCQFGLLLLVK